MQRAQHGLVGHPVGVGEERNLDRREALELHFGPDCLQAAQQVDVVVEGQIGVQAVDDVDFGEGLIGARAQLVEHLFERQRVGARVAGPEARERTEQAARHADVGGFEPEVEIVVGVIAVPLLALAIRQPPDRVQVRMREQPHAVVERQPFAGIELCGHPVEITTPALHHPITPSPHHPITP